LGEAFSEPRHKWGVGKRERCNSLLLWGLYTDRDPHVLENEPPDRVENGKGGEKQQIGWQSASGQRWAPDKGERALVVPKKHKRNEGSNER